LETGFADKAAMSATPSWEIRVEEKSGWNIRIAHLRCSMSVRKRAEAVREGCGFQLSNKETVRYIFVPGEWKICREGVEHG
jgi:hypothetical protein